MLFLIFNFFIFGQLFVFFNNFLVGNLIITSCSTQFRNSNFSHLVYSAAISRKNCLLVFLFPVMFFFYLWAAVCFQNFLVGNLILTSCSSSEIQIFLLFIRQQFHVKSVFLFLFPVMMRLVIRFFAFRTRFFNFMLFACTMLNKLIF